MFLFINIICAAILTFTGNAQPSPLFSDRVPLDNTVPPPQILEIREREFEAIVEFTPNYDEPNGLDQFDDRVVSYLIEWGPVNQNFPFIIRQTRPNGQMQVLQDGVQFKGRIFNLALNLAEDNLVRSNFVEFWFISQSRDINVLRAQNNRFFDDFNGDPGDYDERRWNIAFDLCSLERTANFNNNNQQHVHTQLGALSDDCPAETLSARARAEIEFSATNSIVLDVDGGDFPGHIFFVDVSSEMRDIPFFGQPNPASMFRVGVDNSQLFVDQVFDLGNGLTQVIRVPGSNVNLFNLGNPELVNTNVYTIANIRRPWRITFNANTISIFINEQVILGNLPFFNPLDFTTGHVYMTHENRNSGINGNHAVTMHLDNIGFAGGPPAVQQLNYRNPEFKGFLPAPAQFAFEIPATDDFSDVQTITLFVTVQGTFDFTQAFFFNGAVVMFAPQGGLNPNSVFDLVTAQANVAGILRVGTNVLATPAGDFFVGNVHTELQYGCDANQERAFTVPESQCHFASNSFPISFACDDEILARPTMFFDPADVVFAVDPILRNTITTTFKLDTETSRQLRHNGAGLGIARIEVLVNCHVIQTLDVTGAAFQISDLSFTFSINSGLGEKEIWIRAVDNDGRSSTFHPTRFDPTLENQGRTLDYLPLIVNTNLNALTVRLANVGERDATCSPDPALEQAFIGGNCDDECIPIEGRIKPSVCGEDLNVPFPIFILREGERPPPRAELWTGHRVFLGFEGDWDEAGNDGGDICGPSPTNSMECAQEDYTPEFTVEDCEQWEHSTCDLSTQEPTTFQPAIIYEPQSENHWIDRPVTDGFDVFEVPDFVEIVEAEIAEALATESAATTPDSGSAGGIVALVVILCLASVGVAAFFFYKKSNQQTLPVYEAAPTKSDGTYVPPLAA